MQRLMIGLQTKGHLACINFLLLNGKESTIMAKKAKTGVHTPCIMTNIFRRKLGKEIKRYDKISRAYLATVEGRIPGPIWCMDLTKGSHRDIAILEECTNLFIVYYGIARPIPVTEVGRIWYRNIKQEDDSLQRQKGTVYKNQGGQICIRWTDV